MIYYEALHCNGKFPYTLIISIYSAKFALNYASKHSGIGSVTIVTSVTKLNINDLRCYDEKTSS